MGARCSSSAPLEFLYNPRRYRLDPLAEPAAPGPLPGAAKAAILARLFSRASFGADVSEAHDKKFFDTFMLVLGILIGITGLLYVLARVVSANTQEKHVLIDPAVKAAVAE